MAAAAPSSNLMGLSALSSPFLTSDQPLSKPSPKLHRPIKRPITITPKASVISDLVLGVGVGLPCTVMECGDIIYRSTLPRSDALTLTAPGAALALGAASYLWATPGVAPGFFDMFVLAFIERVFRPTYRKDDIQIGKKLGEGAFGVVYKVSSAKNNPKVINFA